MDNSTLMQILNHPIVQNSQNIFYLVMAMSLLLGIIITAIAYIYSTYVPIRSKRFLVNVKIFVSIPILAFFIVFIVGIISFFESDTIIKIYKTSQSRDKSYLLFFIFAVLSVFIIYRIGKETELFENNYYIIDYPADYYLKMFINKIISFLIEFIKNLKIKIKNIINFAMSYPQYAILYISLFFVSLSVILGYLLNNPQVESVDKTLILSIIIIFLLTISSIILEISIKTPENYIYGKIHLKNNQEIIECRILSVDDKFIRIIKKPENKGESEKVIIPMDNISKIVITKIGSPPEEQDNQNEK